MSKRIVTAFVLALMGSQALAHKDTLLGIAEDGELLGLPNQYSPASFDYRTQTLRVGKRKVIFSPCLRAHVFSGQPSEKLAWSASRYHEPSSMPYYLAWEIRPAVKEYWYSLLFNLETLELLRLYIITEAEDGSWKRHRVDLGGCMDEMREATADVTEST